MIWIGRGFPSLNFANQPIDTATRVDTAVQDCVNVLRDARITLYTIDPAGVMIDPGEYGPGGAFNDPFGGNYQFNRLAKATGGRTLYGRNDVDAEIGTAIQDGSSFYTLSYRPHHRIRRAAQVSQDCRHARPAGPQGHHPRRLLPAWRAASIPRTPPGGWWAISFPPAPAPWSTTVSA